MTGHLILFIALLLPVSACTSTDPCKGPVPLWEGLPSIPGDHRERCEAVVSLFHTVGADKIILEPLEVARGNTGNVLTILPGSIKDTIIVSAHLDASSNSGGALDDFSGVVMMAALYRCFYRHPLRHTLLFIAFDGEERGLLGSRRFVETSPHMPDRIHAVINLECLGLTLPHAWPEGSSDALEDLLEAVGDAYDYDLRPISIPNVRADSESFLKWGLPAVTVDGIGNDDISILDTRRDQQDIIDMEIYDTTFRLLVDYILAVDELSTPIDPINLR